MDHLPVRLGVRISLDGNPSDEELDIAARDLQSELLDAGLEHADLVQVAQPPPGSKGTTGSVFGDLAIAVLPTLLPKLIDLLREWRGRSRDRSLKIRAEIDGKPVELMLDGADFSADAIGALVERMQGRQNTRATRN